MKNLKQEAEVIMNVESGSFKDVSLDDIIEYMMDALNYGVEGEDEIEAFLEKIN